MKVYEIGTGYTSIPAKLGAATEIVVEELVKSLKKRSFDVELIDIYDDKRDFLDVNVIQVKVPKFLMKTDLKLGIFHKLKRVIYSINLFKKIKTILKNTKEKVILHFHNQYNLYFFDKLISKKLRKKAIIFYTVHSYIWQGEWNEIKADVKKRYFQEVKCFDVADKVYILNEKTKKNLVDFLGVDETKLVIVNNGVNIDVYQPIDMNEKLLTKNKMNLNFEKIILQVGSVCDRKNQLETVKLLKNYLLNHKSVAYVFVGGIIDNDYFLSINDFASKENISNQVLYMGEVKPGKVLSDFYKIADVTICNSKLEAFGMVIIESMSCGTPVIISENLENLFNEGPIVYKDNLIDCLEKNIFDQSSFEINKVKSRNIVESVYSWDKISLDYFDDKVKEGVEL